MKKIKKMNEKHTDCMYKNAYSEFTFSSNGGSWYLPSKTASIFMHEHFQEFTLSKNLQGLKLITVNTTREDLFVASIFPNWLYYEGKLYSNNVNFKLYNN